LRILRESIDISALAGHYRARQLEVRWQEELLSTGGTESFDLNNLIGLEDRSAFGSLELPVDMQRLFYKLNPRQKSLLWLACVEGFKHDEIAEVIGVSASSVSVLLSRARTELAARPSDKGLAPIAAGGTY
jgi:RNA polymerase sigma factor (sigma-70 family)